MKRGSKYINQSATGNWCSCVFGKSFIIVLFFFLNSPFAYSQTEDTYDEISIMLNVQRIGNTEIPAIIYKNAAYLPVQDLFDYLKIKNTLSADNDSIAGFFIRADAKYLIDKRNNVIVYQNKTLNLKPYDLISTEANLYLKTDYLSQIFGLDCSFNFRSLSIALTTKLELPAIREMQLEMMYKNISKLKGEKKADTIIRRTYPLFHLGMADWSVLATQQKGFSSTKVNLGLGALIAGGEADVFLNYTNNEAFDKRQQYYSWRFVDNENKALRQVTAGKIFVQSTASVYAPVTGVQFTNTPTTYRKSFGSYIISNTTDPGWMVELYVNNVLINFTRADASGFYTFEVPMVYGNSVVKLRFYSPWGEERFSQENVSVPYNFLPLHQFEYNVTAGVIQDEKKSRYSRANFSYGVSKRITLGGGMEYLSTITSGKSMPFITSSMRIGSNMLLSGEHTYGVRTKGAFTYRLPTNFQVDLQYTKYDRLQTAVRFNYFEEKKLVVSVPVRGKKFSAFSRLTVSQFKLPKIQYTSAEFLLSSIVAGVSSNVTTYLLLTDPIHPFVYTNASLNFRLPAGIRFTPQLQYEYIQRNFSMLKAELEKNLFNRGFLNVSFQKDVINKLNSTTVGFRYNFSFAQTAFSTTHSNHASTTTQSAKGSLMYDDRTGYVSANNQSNIGKGGLIIKPFIDLNCNGKRDAGEPGARGLKLHINGGRVEHNKKDTSIRIIGLEAYTVYYVELLNNSFDNIAWQILKPTISVTVDPNQFKVIDVAIAVVGEASGTVLFDGVKGRTGVGRIIVNFYDSNLQLVKKTLTEPDGFFTFMGLPPGKYSASLDEVQMEKLGMKCVPIVKEFTISQNLDGDIVDNLKFIITRNTKENE